MDHVLCSPSCSKDKMADPRQRALPTCMELACDERKSISVPSLSKCVPGCCGIYQGSYTEFFKEKRKRGKHAFNSPACSCFWIMSLVFTSC